MNNNIFINNLRQKNRQHPNQEPTSIQTPNPSIDSKYNPDINQKYNNLLDTRSNRDFEYSNTMWKPIIGSINKTNINSNDMKIDIKKSNLSNIKSMYEKELAERNSQQELIEKAINNKSKLEDVKIDENLIKIDNNFDDLKKLAINNEKTTIIDSITKLDDLLSSIKNL
jgi:DNA-binding protein YbaB